MTAAPLPAAQHEPALRRDHQISPEAQALASAKLTELLRMGLTRDKDFAMESIEAAMGSCSAFLIGKYGREHVATMLRNLALDIEEADTQ